MDTIFGFAALLFIVAIVAAVAAALYISQRRKKSPSPSKSTVNPAPASAAPVSNTPPVSESSSAPTPQQPSQMSRAEQDMYSLLKRTIGAEYIIHAKTPLSELFKRYHRLASELDTLYPKGLVDFVLLEPTLKTPVLAIELDWRTQTDPVQIKHEKRKAELFRLANMTLLRFRTGVHWGDKERAEILEALPKPPKS